MNKKDEEKKNKNKRKKEEASPARDIFTLEPPNDLLPLLSLSLSLSLCPIKAYGCTRQEKERKAASPAIICRQAKKFTFVQKCHRDFRQCSKIATFSRTHQAEGGREEKMELAATAASFASNRKKSRFFLQCSMTTACRKK